MLFDLRVEVELGNKIKIQLVIPGYLNPFPFDIHFPIISCQIDLFKFNVT